MMMTFEEEQRKRDIENEKISYRNKIKTNLILGGLGIVCTDYLDIVPKQPAKTKSK